MSYRSRVLDTRLSPGAPFSGQLDVQPAGGCGGLPVAAAYALSSTVVPPAPLGYLTLWPQGQTRPGGSPISVWATNPAHLVLDVFGYFH